MDLPIDKKALAELCRQMMHHDEAPTLLPRLYEANQGPVGVLYTKLVDETRDLLEACTDSEVTSVYQHLASGLRMFVDVDELTGQPNLHDLARYHIAFCTHLNFLDFKSAVENSTDESVVLEQYPELAANFDDDGLLVLDDSFELLDGGIRYRGHILHYHQLLRRGFCSNPNFRFLDTFASAYCERQPGDRFAIAIDHRRLMDVKFYRQIVECSMSFGAPLRRPDLDDPNAVGLAVVGRDRRLRDVFAQLFANVQRTEFFWTYRDDDHVKELQVEEVSEPERTFQQYVFNRYVHSERDLAGQRFVHLDGAVKVYLKDRYPERFDSGCHVPDVPKGHRKPKLWRIDGEIDLATWSDLICQFFRLNEMVLEYFDPEEHEWQMARFRREEST
jgi:hypothetical protein